MRDTVPLEEEVLTPAKGRQGNPEQGVSSLGRLVAGDARLVRTLCESIRGTWGGALALWLSSTPRSAAAGAVRAKRLRVKRAGSQNCRLGREAAGGARGGRKRPWRHRKAADAGPGGQRGVVAARRTRGRWPPGASAGSVTRVVRVMLIIILTVFLPSAFL